MITDTLINNFIDKIPPAPKALQETILLLNTQELTKASLVAKTDLALSSYLKKIVNKPIYGFSNEVSDLSQIFGILGVSSSQQTVYNYMMTLLSPDKWDFFDLNENTFHELQARLSRKWKKILEHLGIKDMDIESAITLLPASIIVAEALFSKNKDDVSMLRSVHNFDLNTILYRLGGLDLFDICEKIAKKWDMPSKIPAITRAASGIEISDNDSINTLGKWMHLLLFYELSQSIFIAAGLNDFIDFNAEYVDDISIDFFLLMDIS